MTPIVFKINFVVWYLPKTLIITPSDVFPGIGFPVSYHISPLHY